MQQQNSCYTVYCRNMVSFRYIIVNILHRGDNKDDDDGDDGNDSNNKYLSTEVQSMGNVKNKSCTSIIVANANITKLFRKYRACTKQSKYRTHCCQDLLLFVIAARITTETSSEPNFSGAVDQTQHGIRPSSAVSDSI